MMMQDELNFRRVVVALDVAADFAATIEVAASVAAGWGAGLRGLLVEDESLRRLAALPFAQQIDTVTALRSSIDVTDLESQMKNLAGRVRRELQRIASAHALAWSFEAMRASISADILSLAGDDLLAIGIKTGPAASTLRLGSPWLRILGQVSHPILLVAERPATGGPVVLLYSDTAGGRRALGGAVRIAHKSGRPLIVVAPDTIPESQSAEAEALMQAASIEGRILQSPVADRQALERLIASTRATLLVIARDGTPPDEVAESRPLSTSGALLIL